MSFHHAEGERPGGDCKQAEIISEAAELAVGTCFVGDGIGWIKCDFSRHLKLSCIKNSKFVFDVNCTQPQTILIDVGRTLLQFFFFHVPFQPRI